MSEMKQLYRPEDPGILKRKHDVAAAAVWTIAAGALIACVLFCVFTNTANAEQMELLSVAVFAAAGWVVIYLSTFVVAALRHEREHTERMLAAEKTTLTARVRMEKGTVRIHRSISVRRLSATEGGKTRRLYVDERRARELERALGGEEKLCQLDAAGGYVTAFRVYDENP